jgi:hypothetical protein
MSDDYVIESKKFRNKKTGEIVTQVPLLDIGDYDEVEKVGGTWVSVEHKKRHLKKVS